MTKQVSDILTSGLATANAEYQIAAKRFEYLIARRDALVDKVRFGTLALNGASIIALLTILGGSGKAAAWVGFNPERARWSLLFFALGTILSGLSAWIEADRARGEPADAFQRMSFYGSLASMHAMPASDENVRAAVEQWKGTKDLPLIDFQYSRWAIGAGAFGAACWLGGIAVPVVYMLGWQ